MIYLELEQWTTTLLMIPMANLGARHHLGRGRTGGRRRLNHLVGGVAGTGAATGAVVGTGDGNLGCRLSAWKTRFDQLGTRASPQGPGRAVLVVISTVKI